MKVEGLVGLGSQLWQPPWPAMQLFEHLQGCCSVLKLQVAFQPRQSRAAEHSSWRPLSLKQRSWVFSSAPCHKDSPIITHVTLQTQCHSSTIAQSVCCAAAFLVPARLFAHRWLETVMRTWLLLLITTAKRPCESPSGNLTTNGLVCHHDSRLDRTMSMLSSNAL